MNTMGQEAKDMKREEKAARKAQRRREAELHKWDMIFHRMFLLSGQTLHSGTGSESIKGATAIVETERDCYPEMVKSRVLWGAVIFGPIGALIGGTVLKKDESTIRIRIALANGMEATISAPKKKRYQAIQFARAINMAASL